MFVFIVKRTARKERYEMKGLKRLTAIVLAAAMAASYAVLAAAAGVNKSVNGSVTNVKKHISLFGTRYVTYNFNGAFIDSRNVSAKFNAYAFGLMDSEGKDMVAKAYWPGYDRTNQFGEDGVIAICKHVNDKKGYTLMWKQYKDKLANKYIPDMRVIYGGVDSEDDNDSNYNKEIDRLTTFAEGTAAYELLTKYPYREESRELFAMYSSIPEMMQTGKAAYDACVAAYYTNVSAGTKAMSTYVLNTLVDNLIVPGTFSKPQVTLGSGDDSVIMTARGVIRDYINKITGKTISFADEDLRSAIAGGDGTSPDDAVKTLRRMETIIGESYALANYCHKQSIKFRSEIESRAQSVLDEIKANEKANSDYRLMLDERKA